MGMSREKDRKRKECSFKETSRDKDQKRCIYKKLYAAPKSFFIIRSQEQSTSFSYEHSISFTHGLQHYCILDKLTCTDYVDFGKGQDRFGQTFSVQERYPTSWM